MSYGLGRTLSGGSTKPMSYLKKFIDDTPKFAVRPLLLPNIASRTDTDDQDPTVIPNFLDNHDVARYFTSNPGAAKSSNAIVGNFLISGIPTVYYGLEHEMKGAEDPINRDALWNNGGYKTDGSTYQLIKKLNNIRKGLAWSTKFHEEVGKVVGYSDNDIAILRNNVLIAMTKVSLHPSSLIALSSVEVNEVLIDSAEKEDRALGKSKTPHTPPTPKSSSKSSTPGRAKRAQTNDQPSQLQNYQSQCGPIAHYQPQWWTAFR
jgi:glycosidase